MPKEAPVETNVDVEDHPYNISELEEKLAKYGEHFKVIPYLDLHHYEKIEDIVPCVLLYQRIVPIGHFVSLFINEEGLNYFDPTGFIPDSILHEDMPQIINHAVLCEKLLEFTERTGIPVIYNEYALQGGKDVATCGPWSVTRLLFSELPNEEFKNLFKKISVKERQKKIIKLYQKL